MTVKRILLNKAKAIALVSPEDFDYLSQFVWYLHEGQYTNYAFRKYKRLKIYMHREVMLLQGGCPSLVDHIDGKGLNNQRYNLRPGSPRLNALNRHVIPRNAAGFTCVRKRGNRYEAKLCNKYIGSFTTPEEASEAYLAAKKNLIESLGKEING